MLMKKNDNKAFFGFFISLGFFWGEGDLISLAEEEHQKIYFASESSGSKKSSVEAQVSEHIYFCARSSLSWQSVLVLFM